MKLNRRNIVTGVLGVAMVGSLFGMQAQSPFVADNSVPAMDLTGVDFSTVKDMTMGLSTAPMEIIEYASFTCPHCATFATKVFPKIKEEYIDTGKIRYTHREVFFDRFGVWAALVARCGGEDKYFAIADELYKTQRQWAVGGNGEVISNNLRRIGLASGLSKESLDACLSDLDGAKSLVAWYEANAKKDGINSTPSFVIAGQTHRNLSYDAMKELLDENLAQS